MFDWHAYLYNSNTVYVEDLVKHVIYEVNYMFSDSFQKIYSTSTLISLNMCTNGANIRNII